MQRRIAIVLLSFLLPLGLALAFGTGAPEQTLAATRMSRAAATVSHPDPEGCRTPDPKREGAFLEDRVIAPRKEAWQDAHGGQAAGAGDELVDGEHGGRPFFDLAQVLWRVGEAS